MPAPPRATRASPPVVSPTPEAGRDAVEKLALACLHHGRAAAKDHQLHQALAWFDRALHLEPGLGIAHFCRGMVLADLGRHEEAADAVEQSLGRAADDFAARIQYSRLLARNGHYDSALRMLGPALRAKPHLAAQVLADRDFSAMRDHPHFLQLVGAL